MKIKKRLTLLAIAILMTGCTNDSTSDLSISEVTNPTYKSSIKAIVDQNCIRCHAETPVNGAPMSLVTYADVKEAMLNRPLLERISKANGEAGLMPNGGPRMPQSKIDLFYTWQAQGLSE